MLSHSEKHKITETNRKHCKSPCNGVAHILHVFERIFRVAEGKQLIKYHPDRKRCAVISYKYFTTEFTVEKNVSVSDNTVVLDNLFNIRLSHCFK